MYAGTVDLAKAAAAARAALELLEGRPDAEAGLVAGALGAKIRADFFLGEGFHAEAAQRARSLQGEAPPAAVDSRLAFKLGQWLRYVDDLDGARARLAESEQAARDEGYDSSLANILLNRVVVETWAGRWGHAADLTGQMSDAFEQLGVEPEGIDPWRAYLDAHAGRLDTVRAAAGQRPREPIIAMIWSRCHGLAELASGELQPPTGTSRRRWPSRPRGLPRAGDLARRRGRHRGSCRRRLPRTGRAARRPLRGAGRPITHPLEPGRVRPLPRSPARCAGRPGRGGRGTPASARRARALTGSVRTRAHAPRPGSGLPSPEEEARGTEPALEGSLTILRDLSAQAWVARAEVELRRVAVRRAPDDLSATELRIAHLAAAGLTNRAIGAEVFVTQKTVEANLARAPTASWASALAPSSPERWIRASTHRTKTRTEAGE